jgi:arabinose-5-phosphate isomerase
MEASIKHVALRTIELEANAIAGLSAFINDEFEKAVQLIAKSKGRIVVSGIGKSAVIAQKIVATFNSTGTPSIFMHAADAIHGDLGIVQQDDIVIIISKSGESPEIKVLVPLIKNLRNPLIGMVGSVDSYLAKNSTIILNTTVEQEACPNNLAPTTSTTAQLVMGDALAVCVMKARSFTHGDFARFHPGGTLGLTSKLLVGELMHSGSRLALLQESATVRESLMAITEAQSGSAVVVDSQGILSGYFTDGDIRRRLLRADSADSLLGTPVAQVMTHNPLSFSPQTLAVEALRALRERRVDDAPVVDDDNKPVGVLDVQELLRAGLV